MLQSILEIFTSSEKAEAILSSPIIELIFATLIIGFIVTLFVHIALFNKLKRIRNHLKDTQQMDIEPLTSFKEQFYARQQNDPNIEVETFVQEKFSGWRLLNIPVVSLIKMIQMTVSIFILLGVLGTFIGLTISLGSIQADGAQLVDEVAAVLTGIDVAFYTSIAGMGFSLIMTVLIRVFNTEYMLTDLMLQVESILEGDDHHGMGRLIEVSEMINQSILDLQKTNQQSLQNIESAFSGFQEYTTGLQKAAKDLSAFNEGLHDNLQDFQKLFQQMNKVTDTFGQGTAALNKNFKTLFTYFKNIDRKNERMTAAFENSHEKIQQVSEAQIKTLHEFDHSIKDLKAFTSAIVKEQRNVGTSLGEVNRKTGELVEKMNHHNDELKHIFGHDLSSNVAGVASNLKELKGGFDQVGHSIGQLPQALEVINQTQAEFRHILSDRFQELRQFNQTFGDHLKAHAADSQSFEKRLHDTMHTYEQIGMKNNQLIQEINHMIIQMDQVLNKRENQVEMSVGVLKDTLASYVAGLEGTLGHKLDKVGQSLMYYAAEAQNEVKREFKDLQRLSAETQQHHAQLTRQTLQELKLELQTLNEHLGSFSMQARTLNQRTRVGQNEY